MSSIEDSKYFESPAFQQASLSERLERTGFYRLEDLRERKIEELSHLEKSIKIPLYKTLSRMLYAAIAALVVFSMLAPVLSSTLWFMPWVGLGGSIILSIAYGVAENKVAERKKMLDEVRVAADLLHESRSLYLVGEGDREQFDMRLKSDRQAEQMFGKRESSSVHSIGQICDEYDLAGCAHAKEIVANRFAELNTIDKDFISVVEEEWKVLPASESLTRKGYLPTYCKQYFEANILKLGEEVGLLFQGYDFAPEVKTTLQEFNILKKEMERTGAKLDKVTDKVTGKVTDKVIENLLNGKSVENITYADARKVLCRLEKCHEALDALKREHHSQIIAKIEKDIERISKLFTEEDAQFFSLKKRFEEEKTKIEQLPNKQISDEEKTEQYSASLEALRKLRADFIRLEDKRVRRQGVLSILWEARNARAPRVSGEKPIPTNPVLRSRHIIELRVEDRLKRVDKKIYRTRIASVLGTQLVVEIPLLLVAAIFSANPWVCFATFCGGLVAVPLSSIIELYASHIEEEKRALKMYRDPELSLAGKKVQLFDPEIKQIPGNRPVLKELQGVVQRYGLDGMRPTASKLMIRDEMPRFKKKKRAEVERKPEDLSQVYAQFTTKIDGEGIDEEKRKAMVEAIQAQIAAAKAHPTYLTLLDEREKMVDHRNRIERAQELFYEIERKILREKNKVDGVVPPIPSELREKFKQELLEEGVNRPQLVRKELLEILKRKPQLAQHLLNLIVEIKRELAARLSAQEENLRLKSEEIERVKGEITI